MVFIYSYDYQCAADKAFKHHEKGPVLCHNRLNHHVQCQDLIRAKGQDVAAPLPIPFSANVPGKAAGDSSNAWAPAPTWETREKLRTPNLKPGPAPIVTTIWGMK